MPVAPTPPTESQILSSYLLNPASLPTMLSLDQFRNLLPTRFRTHPRTKLLYRDLQFLRSVDIDNVRENIVHEVRKGDRMKVEMWRALKAGQKNGIVITGEGIQTGVKGNSVTGVDGQVAQQTEQVEMQLDGVLFGPTGSTAPTSSGRSQLHSLETLLEAMEKASDVLEVEARTAEEEAEGLVQEIRETIGALSDLRYSSFAHVGGVDGGGTSNIGDEVKTALKRLESVCESGP